MARLRGSIVCDSCDGYFDGDPVALIDANTELASTLRNPESRKQVRDFWLCSECAPNYVGGAENWFSADFWSDPPVCERCDYEFVDEWGHVCDDCEDGIV